MVCTTLPRICYLNYITNSKLHAIFRTADVFYFPTFITVNNTLYVTLLNLVARTVVQMSHVTLGILESFVTIIAISFITINYYTLCIANNTTHHTSCCAIHRMFCISTIRFLAVESILFYWEKGRYSPNCSKMPACILYTQRNFETAGMCLKKRLILSYIWEEKNRKLPRKHSVIIILKQWSICFGIITNKTNRDIQFIE